MYIKIPVNKTFKESASFISFQVFLSNPSTASPSTPDVISPKPQTPHYQTEYSILLKLC